MKQIKVFDKLFEDEFECCVNEFIKEHPNVVDIQFCFTKGNPYYRYLAMIVYEDGECN